MVASQPGIRPPPPQAAWPRSRRPCRGCLTKDREAFLAFFDLPAEHWAYLRASNPIESAFAAARHRTARTKGGRSIL
ncbi:hypothetical protein MES5069_450013 [Mesorhizobium escarrei]|uniref:Mutator family transposase n=1 Tax=Mesorhizobium escarrei TaxID=666018 RepID=A0ABM9E7C7_9HYPH|nr:hypothetical protein MES5069_450013 [Mesorhizobium escarrei]